MAAEYYAREGHPGAAFRGQVDELAEQYHAVQWVIWNERKDCYPHCGTMYTLAPGARTYTMLEELILTMAEAVDVSGEVTNDEWRVRFQESGPYGGAGVDGATDLSPADDWLIRADYVGTLHADTTREELDALFAGSVVDAGVYLGEGQYDPGTIVYPTFPEKRMDIFWKWSEGGGRVPSMIRWDGEKTLWHTEQGITLGTRLKELERLNGGPFTLTGFDWDYGGTVTNWNGGKLAEQIPDMILRLTPDYDETDTQLTEAEAHAVLGRPVRGRPRHGHPEAPVRSLQGRQVP